MEITVIIEKNIITSEECEKYYVLKDENLQELSLEITNEEQSYYIVNYDTLEIIITKGCEYEEGKTLYKYSEIEKGPVEEETQQEQNGDNRNRPASVTGSTGGTSPDFKTLFAGKDLKEAVSILIPNINHALKVGATARKNEPLIQAMMAQYKSLMTASAALKSLTQNTGKTSLGAQTGTNSQNQNAV